METCLTQEIILRNIFANLEDKLLVRLVCKQWLVLLPIKDVWLEYVTKTECNNNKISGMLDTELFSMLNTYKISHINLLRKENDYLTNTLIGLFGGSPLDNNNNFYRYIRYNKTSNTYKEVFTKDCKISKYYSNLAFPLPISNTHMVNLSVVSHDEWVCRHPFDLTSNEKVSKCSGNHLFININHVNNIDKLLCLTGEWILCDAFNIHKTISEIKDYANESLANYTNVFAKVYTYLMLRWDNLTAKYFDNIIVEEITYG